MSDIQVVHEYSAQGIRKGPSKALIQLIENLGESLVHHAFSSNGPLVVDQGCGQLRNVETLLSISNRIVLVDTERQLSTKHLFYDQRLTVCEFAEQHWSDKEVTVLTAKEFAKLSLNADIVFSINVLDVVLPTTRDELLRAARRNLSTTGMLAVFVPRNDTWTLRRCRSAQRFTDGYVFRNRDAHTFYHNWTNSEMKSLVNKWGFEIVKDVSVHRYIRLMCRPV
jgi:hypothetical protein